MATITSKEQLKDYILRRLGSPVINIEVDTEQLYDRIDDAIEKWQDYHYDGTERGFVAHRVTAQDKVNKYITLSEDVIGVIGVLPITDSRSSSNLFDVRYQFHLNELYDMVKGNGYLSYAMAMTHIANLNEMFVGIKQIRFNRHTDRLYIDMDWTNGIDIDEYIVIDCYKAIDPDVYTDAYNDKWVKRYATALVKRQWGQNLSKFDGIQMPGGTTFNGIKIYDDANAEIEKLEDTLISDYSLPVTDLTG